MKKFLLSALVALTAAASFAGDPTYTALRAARPDGRTIAVNNFTFDRDVYHVTLNGTMHLLAPVSGQTVGAVFTGHGSYELTPASDVERKSLAINADDASLKTFRDEFDSMTIFDAELLEQLMKTASKSGTPDPAATQAFDRFLNFERKDYKTNVHVRVAQALLNGETSTLFIGVPDGKKFPRMVLIVDGLGVLDGEESALYSADSNRGGFWYSSHLKGEKPHANVKLAQAKNYSVDTSIVGFDDLSGTTIIEGTTNAPLQVLPIALAPTLRISEASFAPNAKAASWTPIAFVQEQEKEDADAALVFPAPLQQGESFAVRLKYRGKEVLRDAGDGNYYVRARTSWYPNLGTFDEMAMYELTYRVPKANQVISVGEPAGDSVAGETRVVTFKTAEPVRVAGFNVGKFKKISKTDKDTGLTVDVYTNPGTPNVIKEINMALEGAQQQVVMGESGPMTSGDSSYAGPHQIHLDTNGLAQSAMTDAVNASRVAQFYFGATPLQHVSISQQSEWDFGQSWPGLVYLPYMAVLSGTTRVQLGLAGANDAAFIEQVGPHEMAHQWWGHSVGAATYHDAWLNEGFADFTAALVLQATGGAKKYNDFWETSRKSIVTKPVRAFVDNIAAGPITQGYRLYTWRNQSAYQALVYEKGAYVLHMLRMLMQDRSNKANPDEAFIAMMSDFARTYAGRNATTADFKRMVERHMTPTLNATGNGSADWFFDQWVHGTAIPKLTSKFDVQAAADGKFHISGSITQAEVPDDFKVMVPVYAEFDKGQIFKIAAIPLVGNSTRPVDFEVKMPKKPKSVSINAMHDVLAR